MPTVWTIDLDDARALAPQRLAWLSADERTRAARFRFPQHADRWRVAHVALRDILGRAVQVDPASLPLRSDPRGKPWLDLPGAPAFNLTHSAARALVAVGQAATLGVDVEAVEPVPEMDGVAASHFAPEEQAWLRDRPAADRLHAFYRIWTRKEAYVKATGIGVGPALARFAVDAREDASRLLRADDDPAAHRNWTVSGLALDGPYVGAIAIPEPAPKIVIARYEPS